MRDPYLYADIPVLRNKLGIKTEKTLDLIEAEQSRANMMLLYEQGFSDFTPEGLCKIHQFLFGDVYEWAGKYRVINIQKSERLLAGQSVWYSNDDDIERDLENAFYSYRVSGGQRHSIQLSWILGLRLWNGDHRAYREHPWLLVRIDVGSAEQDRHRRYDKSAGRNRL